VQRCLNIVDAVESLCGLAATRLRTGKPAGSPCLEELPMTLCLRDRCGPLYRRMLIFCIASAICFKTLNTSLSMYSDVIPELMY
jgi:hypothetical protein